jgi:excisionase family DNA binding protein
MRDRAVYTPDEVAAVLGISARAVRQAILAGQLPGSAFGTGQRRRYVIPAEAFARYLAGEWRAPETGHGTSPSHLFLVRRKGW